MSRVKVLYFAKLRDDVGAAAEEVALPEGVSTVAALRAHLMARGGTWTTALGSERAIRIAVNQEMAQPSTRIGPGDEVAFFPPVTGG